jgi:hypothetical protein
LFVAVWRQWARLIAGGCIVTFRREFALIISAAICAIAVIFPAPKPDLNAAVQGTRFDIGSQPSAEAIAKDDVAMAALRQQASAALASLQAASAARP